MQQDAHEFLNFLINHINEIILGKTITKINNNPLQILINNLTFQRKETKTLVNRNQAPATAAVAQATNRRGFTKYFKAFSLARPVV